MQLKSLETFFCIMGTANLLQSRSKSLCYIITSEHFLIYNRSFTWCTGFWTDTYSTVKSILGHYSSDIHFLFLYIGSPLRDKLSLAILHLQEDGKVQELYDKWWKGTGKCMSERKAIESKANALDVNNVGGIFVVLLAGLALAIIVAFLEFIWKSKKNAREDRVRNWYSFLNKHIRISMTFLYNLQYTFIIDSLWQNEKQILWGPLC